MRRFIRSISLAAAFFVVVSQLQAGTIVISSPGFDTSGGKISGALDLNLLDPAPSAITSALGSSGWYGQANVTAVATLGFRPDVEVNQASTSPGQGMISFSLGASLGGLAGVEMPEADLWQPMASVSFAANTTYTFSIDMDTGSLLDINALSSRGFGIGFTTNSATSGPGTFVADSLSSPALLSISALTGTAQRLVLSYTTGATAPTGDMGIAVFAGRGVQALSLGLLNDYRVDNAAVASSPAVTPVPEPSVLAHLVGGIAVLAHWRRRRRTAFTPKAASPAWPGAFSGKM